MEAIGYKLKKKPFNGDSAKREGGYRKSRIEHEIEPNGRNLWFSIFSKKYAFNSKKFIVEDVLEHLLYRFDIALLILH